MKLLVINPNTSDGFTAIAQKAANRYKRADTIVDAVSSTCGPLTLEGYFDEIISSVGVMDRVKTEKDNYDGFIVACFSDHFSIYGSRQITPKPVVGILEPPILLAKQLGAKFSIVMPSIRWKPIIEENLINVGLASSCANVCVLGMEVEDLERLSQEELEEQLCQLCLKTIKENGAETIVLGCCGLAGFDERLEARLGVPVLDPIGSAVKVLESIVDMGKKTSQVNSFGPIMHQESKGIPAVFQDLYK